MLLGRSRVHATRRMACALRRATSSAPDVHPTAVVEPGAELADGVRIGPHCVVCSGARVGRRTRLDSHVSLAGAARVGDDCHLRPFSSVGGEAQDKKAANDDSGEVWVGDRVMVGEHVTVHRGTPGGGGVTRVGDDCWLLAGSHVAHDATLGRAVVLSNHAAVAGHVSVGDGAVLGGGAGVRQQVSIGRLAMVGGMSAVTANVPPFTLVAGPTAALRGANLVGLQRAGLPRPAICAVLSTLRTLFGPALGGSPLAPRWAAHGSTLEERAAALEQRLREGRAPCDALPPTAIEPALELVAFVRDCGRRSRIGLCLPASGPAGPWHPGVYLKSPGQHR